MAKSGSRNDSIATLTVEAKAAVELVVLDHNFVAVARGVGALSARLPKGIYKLRASCGRGEWEKIFELDRSLKVSVPFIPFGTASPLMGTTRTHENHENAAREVSQRRAATFGKGATIFTMTRWWTEKSPSRRDTALPDPMAGISLHGERGEHIANLWELAERGDDDRDRWAACTLGVAPGLYRLRRAVDDDVAEQTITALRGWQTQAFLLLEPSRPDAPDMSTQPPLRTDLSILICREGAGPLDDMLLRTDAARLALADERSALTPELGRFATDKDGSPMLALFAAHLLLVLKHKEGEDARQQARVAAAPRSSAAGTFQPPRPASFDEGLFNDIFAAAKHLFGAGHPDIRALALAAKTRPRTAAPITVPPMLSHSWSMLVAASRDDRSLLPFALWQEAGEALATRPFFTRRLPSADRASRRLDRLSEVSSTLLKQLRELGPEPPGPRGAASMTALEAALSPETVQALPAEAIRKRIAEELQLPLSVVEQVTAAPVQNAHGEPEVRSMNEAVEAGAAGPAPPAARQAAAARTSQTGNPEERNVMAMIVIDPGHGGTSNLLCSSANNARGPVHGTLEKHLTLDVAKRVKRELGGRGHNVVLTRDRDVNVAGAERAQTARRHNAAVLVSIHFNASTNHSAQGTETFVHTNHSDTGASARLCRAVQAAVLRATGLSDRNRHHPPHFIKKAGLCVLNPASHGSGTAAVLAEISFLDRADEEERLLRDSYKEEVAIAIADGIESFLGVGVAPEMAPTGEEEFEDAVAMAAAEAGLSVAEMMSRAPSSAIHPETAGGRGGRRRAGEHEDGVPAEAAEEEQPSVFRSMARSIMVAPVDLAEDSANDVIEFSTVPIGDAPDFETAIGDEAAATAIVEEMFGGVQSEAASFEFAEFEKLIRGLELQHFTPVEFLFLGASNQSGRCAGTNALPPRSLWQNIVNTARMLNRIRAKLDAPVHILSCYRNRPYNTCIGGAGASQHMSFNAIDWRCDTGSPAEWRDVARSVRSSDPRFKGGVGFYPKSRFIHIDTRGHNVDF